MTFATVYSAFSPAESQLVRARLEAAGFHPFVLDELAAFSTEGYAAAIGGVRVQVPEAEAQEARDFLAAPSDSETPIAM
jgi:hypothetical protein